MLGNNIYLFSKLNNFKSNNSSKINFFSAGLIPSIALVINYNRLLQFKINLFRMNKDIQFKFSLSDDFTSKLH